MKDDDDICEECLEKIEMDEMDDDASAIINIDDIWPNEDDFV